MVYVHVHVNEPLYHALQTWQEYASGEKENITNSARFSDFSLLFFNKTILFHYACWLQNGNIYHLVSNNENSSRILLSYSTYSYRH